MRLAQRSRRRARAGGNHRFGKTRERHPTPSCLPTIRSRARARCPISLPPLDKIKDEHFEPALVAGMAEQRKEIDAIAKNPAAPTFENTIVAMERSGQLLTRASAVFGNLTASNTNPQLEKAADGDVAEAVGAHRRDLSSTRSCSPA